MHRLENEGILDFQVELSSLVRKLLVVAAKLGQGSGGVSVVGMTVGHRRVA